MTRSRSLVVLVPVLLGATAAAQVQTALPAPTKSPAPPATRVVVPPGTSNLAFGSDSCSTPEMIDGLGHFGFDTTNATTGAEGQTEAACNFFASTAIGRDVWFTWTAPASGTITLRTCQLTSIDTKVAVYAGSGCPTGSALACNDDACSLQTQLTFPATAGALYTIQLGVYATSPGGAASFELSIAPPPAGCAIDDGVSENAVGATTGGTLVWVNRFDAVGAATVASVSVAFGTPLFPDPVINGLPVTFGVWDDPNDDGIPHDLELVATVNTVVSLSSTDQFVTAAFPAPVAVSGVYFVGALMVHPPSRFPASLDQTAPQPGVSWIGVGPAGAVDPADLAGTLTTQQLTATENLFFPGTWLVRADCAVSTGSSICGSPSIPCPCGNPGGAGRGCANTGTFAGALLAAQGLADVGNSTAVLTVSGMQPNVSFCQFAQAPAAGTGVVFGDGVLCLGPGQMRIGLRPVVEGSAALGQGISAPLDVLGGVIAPGSRAYQVVYRNAAPYCTPATFNATNGVVLTWF